MNQLQKKTDNFGALLNKHRKSIIAALPHHIDANQWMRIALTAYTKNPDLQLCSPVSVFLCCVEAAQLGLTLDGALGHAYIVKYKKTAQFICGYKGYVELAFRSGKIAKISARVVREGDKLDYKYGLTPVLNHTPARVDRGQLTHVYAIANFNDVARTQEFVVLDKETVLKHRDASPSAGSQYSPWKNWEEAMWQKTAVRDLVKMLPLTPEIQKVVGLDGQAEAGVTQTIDIPSYIEEEATEAFLGTEAKMETLKEKLTEHMEGVEGQKAARPDLYESHKPIAPVEKQTDTDIGGLPLEQRQDKPHPRKGKIGGQGIAKINKAALENPKMDSIQFRNILGIKGVEAVAELNAEDYKEVLQMIVEHGKAPFLEG